MFFLSFVTLGLATAALTSPPKRTLAVEISGPASVNSIDDLKFIASVKNTGADTVKLFKYSNILDDKLPTQSFIVTKDGSNVPFTGTRISFSPDRLDDSAFVIIPSGETLTTQHEVGSSFDFASTGPGKYTFEPIATFQTAEDNLDGKVSMKLRKVQATTNKVEVVVNGDIAKREYPRYQKRSLNVCTDATKKAFIDAAYAEAKALATGAVNYATTGTTASATAYIAYFGATPLGQVITNFNSVANENFPLKSLDCSDPSNLCGNPNVEAYTNVRDKGFSNTFFCPVFFQQVPSTSLCTGTPVDPPVTRGGTVLHELTHALEITNINTATETYGCAESMALSDADSVKNADNYTCFATQAYVNVQCPPA